MMNIRRKKLIGGKNATLVHENEESYPLLVNQLDRSTKRDGYSYSYEMSHEDFYIYMLVHNSNHFRIGGMGARMVLDSYVFLKNHQSELDYDYLNVMLEKIGIASRSAVRSAAAFTTSPICFTASILIPHLVEPTLT